MSQPNGGYPDFHGPQEPQNPMGAMPPQTPPSGDGPIIWDPQGPPEQFTNVGAQQLAPGSMSQGPYDPYGQPLPVWNGVGEPPLSRPLYGATMKQAVVRFFKKYARFSGYASRSEYWFATLALTLVSLVVLIPYFIGLSQMTMAMPTDGGRYGELPNIIIPQSSAGLFLISLGVLVLMSMATLVPSLAITWRRLHDAGYSGLFYLLCFVPFGSLVLLVLLCMPSKPYARRPEWDDHTGD